MQGCWTSFKERNSWVKNEIKIFRQIQYEYITLTDKMPKEKVQGGHN